MTTYSPALAERLAAAGSKAEWTAILMEAIGITPRLVVKHLNGSGTAQQAWERGRPVWQANLAGVGVSGGTVMIKPIAGGPIIRIPVVPNPISRTTADMVRGTRVARIEGPSGDYVEFLDGPAGSDTELTLDARWEGGKAVLVLLAGPNAFSFHAPAELPDVAPEPAQPAPPQIVLPTVVLENTGAAQESIPFTFGQVFAVGHLAADAGLVGTLADGTAIYLQVDRKATHPDGSVRHAIISGILPRAAAGEVKHMSLMAVPPSPGKPFPSAYRVFRTRVYLEGGEYAASSESGMVKAWISGSRAMEYCIATPLMGPNSAHPHLTVRFGIRVYASGHTRVEVIIENNKAFARGAQNYTYDVEITIGDKTIKKTITHYHHARWRHVEWIGQEPTLIVHPDTNYLIASKAIPNYDTSIVPSEKALASWAATLKPGAVGPMKTGPVTTYMPMTGGRPDIGPLPGWTVCYLLSHDKRVREVMHAAADGAGSWPIHYRDENTGYPLRLDTGVNSKVSLHMNMQHQGPLPSPRTVAGKSGVPYTPDTAHQPSLAYVPYLISGEHYYLEELHFWAAWNPLETASGNHGGTGLVRWQQVRGQAWSLRTMGHAAYITPDDHPMKDYFVRMVDANLDFYHDAYVMKNPNNLGMYDGSGKNATNLGGTPAGTGCAPWQDDYFTWALGYLAELGFEKAEPVFKWKAKFAVGRMTAPGFCWLHATDYYYKARDYASAPVYASFAELYQKNYSGTGIPDDSRKMLRHPAGLLWIDQPCGSQAQVDWIHAASGNQRWKFGQVFGYADSVEGYPANLQPALSVAVDLGAAGAAEAWAKFESRSVKPDYRNGPQFAIIPRSTP